MKRLKFLLLRLNAKARSIRASFQLWRNTWRTSLKLARVYRREPVDSRQRIVGFMTQLARERAMARPMVLWWPGDRDDDLGDFATVQEREAYHAGAAGPFRRLVFNNPARAEASRGGL